MASAAGDEACASGVGCARFDTDVAVVIEELVYVFPGEVPRVSVFALDGAGVSARGYDLAEDGVGDEGIGEYE